MARGSNGRSNKEVKKPKKDKTKVNNASGGVKAPVTIAGKKMT